MKNPAAKTRFSKSAPRRGQTMIGLLVAVAIVIAIAGIYLSQKGKNPDGSDSSHTALRRSIDLAQEVTLQSNLNQIQQIIGMYKQDSQGKPPASFDELQKYAKFPAEMWINPVDKKPLGYDPASGLMIVTPYEGQSPAIARMTVNPMHGADQATSPAPPPSDQTVAPDAGGGQPMPKMPDVPNSSADPGAETE